MKLESYLALAGLTAKDFAIKTDVAPSTISRAIRGERRPRWKTLAKICQATEGAVRPNDFMDGVV